MEPPTLPTPLELPIDDGILEEELTVAEISEMAKNLCGESDGASESEEPAGFPSMPDGRRVSARLTSKLAEKIAEKNRKSAMAQPAATTAGTWSDPVTPADRHRQNDHRQGDHHRQGGDQPSTGRSGRRPSGPSSQPSNGKKPTKRCPVQQQANKGLRKADAKPKPVQSRRHGPLSDTMSSKRKEQLAKAAASAGSDGGKVTIRPVPRDKLESQMMAASGEIVSDDNDESDSKTLLARDAVSLTNSNCSLDGQYWAVNGNSSERVSKEAITQAGGLADRVKARRKSAEGADSGGDAESASDDQDLTDFANEALEESYRKGTGAAPVEDTGPLIEFSDSSSDETAEYEEESDASDPGTAYCLCRQPFTGKWKRFMIQCDMCDDWYHGDCVGISENRGLRMEQNDEMYICPMCTDIEQRNQAAVNAGSVLINPASINDDQRDALRKEIYDNIQDRLKSHTNCSAPSWSSLDSDEDSDEDGNEQSTNEQHTETVNTSKTQSKRTHRLGQIRARTCKEPVSSASASACSPKTTGQTSTPAAGSTEKRKFIRSGKPAKAEPKPVRGQQHCIATSCTNWAKENWVYCSVECIERHASEMLVVFQKYCQNSNKKKRIVLIEKSGERVVNGPTAPTLQQMCNWLRKNPSFEISRPNQLVNHLAQQVLASGSAGTESAKQQTNEEQTRVNVRKQFSVVLYQRTKDATDLHISSGELKKLAASIELELFRMHNDSGSRYRTHFRQLSYNLKDPKNSGLFRKVIQGSLTPSRLVRLSPEKLASNELRNWRAQASEQQRIDAVAHRERQKALKQKQQQQQLARQDLEKERLKQELMSSREKLHSSSVRKTPPPSTAGPSTASEVPSERQYNRSPAMEDTTAQHGTHLYSTKCSVCTGKAVHGGDSQMVSPVSAQRRRVWPKASQAHGLPPAETSATVDSYRTASDHYSQEEPAYGGPELSYDYGHTMVPKTDGGIACPLDTIGQRAGIEAVWKGMVFMNDVARFATRAIPLSGPCNRCLQTHHQAVEVVGRITHGTVWKYLAEIRGSSHKICLVVFEALTRNESAQYLQLFHYLDEKQRFGVVDVDKTLVKDFYLIPLRADAQVSRMIRELDVNGVLQFPERPHVLAGIAVLQRDRSQMAINSGRRHRYQQQHHLDEKPNMPERAPTDAPAAADNVSELLSNLQALTRQIKESQAREKARTRGGSAAEPTVSGQPRSATPQSASGDSMSIEGDQTSPPPPPPPPPLSPPAAGSAPMPVAGNSAGAGDTPTVPQPIMDLFKSYNVDFASSSLQEQSASDVSYLSRPPDADMSFKMDMSFEEPALCADGTFASPYGSAAARHHCLGPTSTSSPLGSQRARNGGSQYEMHSRQLMPPPSHIPQAGASLAQMAALSGEPLAKQARIQEAAAQYYCAPAFPSPSAPMGRQSAPYEPDTPRAPKQAGRHLLADADLNVSDQSAAGDNLGRFHEINDNSNDNDSSVEKATAAEGSQGPAVGGSLSPAGASSTERTADEAVEQAGGAAPSWEELDRIHMERDALRQQLKPPPWQAADARSAQGSMPMGSGVALLPTPSLPAQGRLGPPSIRSPIRSPPQPRYSWNPRFSRPKYYDRKYSGRPRRARFN